MRSVLYPDTRTPAEKRADTLKERREEQQRKKAQQEEEAQLQAEMPTALHWTEEVPFDLSPPTGFMVRNHGWNIQLPWGHAFSQPEVYEAWSDSMSHGRGHPDRTPRVSGSQGSAQLYSTRLLALKALRHEIERVAARQLALLDREIAKAERETK